MYKLSSSLILPMRLTLLTCSLLTAAIPAQAAIYYVAPQGNDRNRGTSARHALRTIEKAAQIAHPGALVLVAPGNYEGTVKVSGKRRLEFRAMKPHQATIRGPVTIVDSSGVIFKGFRFAGHVERFIVCQNSQDSQLVNCQFFRGRQGLLLRSGSLVLEECELRDFAQDGIQVDGAAKLLVKRSRIQGSGGSAINMRKNAYVSVDGSRLTGNRGDGVHVEIVEGSIPDTDSGCECRGVSPLSMKQDAHKLLSNANPRSEVFRQAISNARNAIYSSLHSTMWKDAWHATTSSGPRVYDKSLEAIQHLDPLRKGEIDFSISGDDVVVNQPFRLDVKVLGAEIVSGSYKMPVTTQFRVGKTNRQTYQPWGSFGSPTKGNVNDSGNPRSFTSSDTHPVGTKITVAGRSWRKKSSRYNGSQDSHWQSSMTVDSNSRSGNLKVLRDGSSVPNMSGYAGQSSAASFLSAYIEDGRIKLAPNQAIFLFELGTTNLSSSAADFQDLVVVVTMEAVEDQTPPEDTALIKRAIDLLIEADKNLAKCAMNDAVCATGQSRAEAENAYNRGLSQAAKEHYPQASRAFKHAWEAAQKSLSNGRGNSRAGTDRVTRRPTTDAASLPEPVVNISSSQLSENKTGVALVTAGKFSSRQSDYSRNKTWGLRLRGTARLENCRLQTNSLGGMQLSDMKSTQLQIKELSLENNVQYGLFAKNCNLSFDRTRWAQLSISGSQYTLGGEGGELSFRDVKIQGGSKAGVWLSRGSLKASQAVFSKNGHGLEVEHSSLSLSSCTFSDNRVGMVARDFASLVASGCRFVNNRKWGVSLYKRAGAPQSVVVRADLLARKAGSQVRGTPAGLGQALFAGCRIENNSTSVGNRDARTAAAEKKSQNFSSDAGGIYLSGLGKGDLRLRETVVANNGANGLYATACRLEFDKNMIDRWLFSQHDCQLSGSNSSFRFSNFTVQGGRLCAVRLQQGELQANNSTFSGSAVGVSCSQPKQLMVTNSRFTKNSQCGVQLQGGGSFERCTFVGNRIGLLLQDTQSTDTVAVRSCTLKDNPEIGIYAVGARLTLDTKTLLGTKITGSKTVFSGLRSQLTFTGLTVEGGSQFGIAAYDGQLKISGVKFCNNGTGLFARNNTSCAISSSTFTNNSAEGARVQGKASFKRCVLEKNGNGLTITNSSAGDLSLDATRVVNNTSYGVLAVSSTLTLGSLMQAGWTVEDNGSNFGGRNSKLVFRDFTISKGKAYGLVLQQGKAELTNCTLSGNGTGAHIDAGSVLTAINTTFTSNRLYGASLEGQAALQGCSFVQNKYGLRLANLSTGDMKCQGTRAANNTESGLRLEKCTLTLTDGGLQGLIASGNRIGVDVSQSTVSFDGFTSRQNTIGAKLESSEVKITQSTFADCTIGLQASNNKSFNAKASEFTRNKSWGVTLVGAGDLHDCKVSKNGHGLLLVDSQLTDSRLSGTALTDNTGRGLQTLRATVKLSDQGNQKWTLARNNINLYGEKSDITLTAVELTDAVQYGVYANHGALTLQQAKITSREYGVYGLYANGFTVDRTQISASGSNPRGWGVMNLYGDFSLRNTIISGMKSGVFTAGTSAKIYNATIADAGDYGVYAHTGKTNVMNTIISGKEGSYGLYQGSSAKLEHSHNLIHGFSAAFHNTKADPNSVLRSPRFVSQAKGDLRLSKGSPAINAGKDLAGVLRMDVLGNQRPSHKVFEIGAYEYMEKSGSFRVLDWQEKR